MFVGGIPSSGVPAGCKDLAWAGKDPASMSGAAVSDGRFPTCLSSSARSGHLLAIQLPLRVTS